MWCFCWTECDKMEKRIANPIPFFFLLEFHAVMLLTAIQRRSIPLTCALDLIFWNFIEVFITFSSWWPLVTALLNYVHVRKGEPWYNLSGYFGHINIVHFNSYCSNFFSTLSNCLISHVLLFRSMACVNRRICGIC